LVYSGTKRSVTLLLFDSSLIRLVNFGNSISVLSMAHIGIEYYVSVTTGNNILTRASNGVRATFSTQYLDTFSATWFFIATWHNVTYFGGSTTTPVTLTSHHITVH